jgi:hypothetical protein
MDVMPPESGFFRGAGQKPVIKASHLDDTQTEPEREFLQALSADKISGSHMGMTSYTGFTFRGQYCVVSERGSGNLTGLMEDYLNGKHADTGYERIVQQFASVTGALAKIHGPANGNIDSITTSNQPTF